MAFLRFLLPAVLSLGFIFLLDHRIPVGDQKLPPLGPFFSPQHGFWMNAEPAIGLPEDKVWRFEGLKHDVTIVFDEDLVPHIFASDDEDAAFAQGYVSARLRLFQMDISSRAPLGRLSEYFGETTLEYDLGQRRKGLLEAAERLAAAWEQDPRVRPLMQAFVDGANRYIGQLSDPDLPIEYKLLDVRPEPFTFTRCAGFLLAMCETLARTAHDIPLSNALRKVGPADFTFLYPGRNPHDIPVIPDSLPDSGTRVPAPDIPSLSFAWPGDPGDPPVSEAGIGSNNWAVRPEKTRDHTAMLCNDPHLTLTLPSIWLEMQISTPEHSAYGVAFPPLVGIAIGFNEQIAWGFTNAGQDVMDWYAIRWADPAKTRYLLDGRETPATLRAETILVRDRDVPVMDTVRYTVWGPVPEIRTGRPGADLAMHWLPLLDIDDRMALMFHRINQAKDIDSWMAPLLDYDVPMQNALFGSVNGDIALRVSGLMPIRKGWDGRLVQDGSASIHAWDGYVPDRENPMAVNPPQGYLASANQQSTGDHYPFPYTGVFEDWRGRYLNSRLQASDSLTVEDMMALQTDNTSLFAREALPVFAAAIDSATLTPEETAMLNDLSGWDARYEGSWRMPLLFELWYRQVDSLTWDELYSDTTIQPVEIPEPWLLLDLIRTTPDLPWFDRIGTPERESVRNVVTDAFQRACVQLNDLAREGIASWSAFQSTDIRHIARIPAFSAMDLETGGNRWALNAVTSTNGPSWRMIVTLDSPIRAFGIYPGGQSGNPGSPFYRRFLPAWLKGSYRSLRLRTLEELQASGTTSTLDLKSH